MYARGVVFGWFQSVPLRPLAIHPRFKTGSTFLRFPSSCSLYLVEGRSVCSGRRRDLCDDFTSESRTCAVLRVCVLSCCLARAFVKSVQPCLALDTHVKN